MQHLRVRVGFGKERLDHSNGEYTMIEGCQDHRWVARDNGIYENRLGIELHSDSDCGDVDGSTGKKATAG
jgi:hypothetical protein